MKRKLWQSILLYATVIVACAVVLFPVYWMVVTSLQPPGSLRAYPPHFLPPDPQWQTYIRLFIETDILRWMANSAIVAVAATGISMVAAVLAGYSLSRYQTKSSENVGLFILMSKMLPATMLIIPLFGIMRSLGLMGSLWSLIFAHATAIVPFATWMLKGYFDSIPNELEQAAQVDGCTPWGALFRVILPVAAPGLAATSLYGFVLSWADYLFARTFLANNADSWTVNLGIATFKGEYQTDWNLVMAASLLAALPIMIAYLFLQRFLVGGMTAGAGK
ncbi:ABC transporter permease [Devosia sp. Root413D1]|uniref:carbohydrate ABC transporter permease n=1 Tax=Devosia sp. Root413D1 TaxID=1736531 RepID=UPI0006F9A1AD|nr:carbohydrate ABC transporter permease [Devosia sp. Root413D1]KQW83517.1 ABC transporter permease [Devosia sp. Root413D1]